MALVRREVACQVPPECPLGWIFLAGWCIRFIVAAHLGQEEHRCRGGYFGVSHAAYSAAGEQRRSVGVMGLVARGCAVRLGSTQVRHRWI